MKRSQRVSDWRNKFMEIHKTTSTSTTEYEICFCVSYVGCHTLDTSYYTTTHTLWWCEHYTEAIRERVDCGSARHLWSKQMFSEIRVLEESGPSDDSRYMRALNHPSPPPRHNVYVSTANLKKYVYVYAIITVAETLDNSIENGACHSRAFDTSVSCVLSINDSMGFVLALTHSIPFHGVWEQWWRHFVRAYASWFTKCHKIIHATVEKKRSEKWKWKEMREREREHTHTRKHVKNTTAVGWRNMARESDWKLLLPNGAQAQLHDMTIWRTLLSRNSRRAVRFVLFVR